MSLLVEPIKRDLVISDTQFSLLHGFAFAIFYTLLGLPLGRLADRANRRWITSIGVLLWSLMTAVCGLTKTFTTLFLARIGVGVGEAALRRHAGAGFLAQHGGLAGAEEQCQRERRAHHRRRLPYRLHEHLRQRSSLAAHPGGSQAVGM